MVSPHLLAPCASTDTMIILLSPYESILPPENHSREFIPGNLA